MHRIHLAGEFDKECLATDIRIQPDDYNEVSGDEQFLWEAPGQRSRITKASDTARLLDSGNDPVRAVAAYSHTSRSEIISELCLRLPWPERNPENSFAIPSLSFQTA